MNTNKKKIPYVCMKILSIDVGMKCLAYCILDVTDDLNYSIEKWGVMDLCEQKYVKCCGKTKKNKPCDKLSKYFRDDHYYCKIHAKKTSFKIPTNDLKEYYLKKCKVNELRGIYEKICEDAKKDKKQKKLTKAIYLENINNELKENYLFLVPTIKANSISLITYGRRLKNKFNSMLDNINIDRVLVENQIGPLALRMKTLQGMVMQHFIEIGCECVEEISASNKLKDFIPSNKKTKYIERKRLGIKVTTTLLNDNNSIHSWLEHFLNHKKKDDLADSFLQGLWYIRHILKNN